MSDNRPDTNSSGAGDSAETLGARGNDSSTSASKDPSDWVTGDEPMTGAQRSYLDTLAREAGEELPADLTKAQASEHIDRLQEKTGRGRGFPAPADRGAAAGGVSKSGNGPSELDGRRCQAGAASR